MPTSTVGPFVDSRLPENIEQGARGGPTFSTSITDVDSGYEKRNINWSQARAKYTISYGIQGQKDFDAVRAFFYARRGRAVGFRFKDWTDFEFDQVIATGTAADTRTQFQIFKRYESDTYYYDRVLYKLVAGTVTVYKNGAQMLAGFTVNYNTGIVTLNQVLNENDVIEAKGEFDVPVRFDTDEFALTATLWNAASVDELNLIELKNYESNFSGA